MLAEHSFEHECPVYPWSSFRVNAYGSASELVIPHPVCDALGLVESDRHSAYQAMFIDELPAADVEAIRKATRGGFALGSEQFVKWVAKELGVRPVRKQNSRPGTPPTCNSAIGGLSP